MDASGRPERGSRIRLLLLTAIAFVGYEYALYRHWRAWVPLVPTTTLELPPGRVPIGFGLTGEFVVGQQLSPTREVQGVVGGPLEFRSVPAGELVAEGLTPDVRVATSLPMSAGPVSDRLYSYIDRDWFPLSSRMGPAHDTLDARWRAPVVYCIDRDRFLCLENGTLQAYDPKTDRVAWTLLRVQSVVIVEGGCALVMRLPEETSRGTGQASPVLVMLDDGLCDEQLFPDEDFEVSDLSPDGRLIAHRTEDAFEVWSIKKRARLWRKTFLELGTRELKFSDDGEMLVNCSLAEDGRFQSSTIRSSDGERLTTGHEPDGSGEGLIPPMPMSTATFAIFRSSTSRHESDLGRWVQRAAARVGVFMNSTAHSRHATIYDVDRGQPLGMIDATEDPLLLTAADGSGFAVYRRRSPAALELYTYPPRSDWLWWSIRAVGLPLMIALLVIAAPRYRRWKRSCEIEHAMLGNSDRLSSFTG